MGVFVFVVVVEPSQQCAADQFPESSQGIVKGGAWVDFGVNDAKKAEMLQLICLNKSRYFLFLF